MLEIFFRCLVMLVCSYLRVETKILIGSSSSIEEAYVMVDDNLELFFWGKSKSVSLVLSFRAGQTPEKCFHLATSIICGKCEIKVELEWASISIASLLCKHPLKTPIFSGVTPPSTVHAVLQSLLYSIQRTKLQGLLGWGKGSHSARRVEKGA